MAKSPSEQITELRSELSDLNTDVGILQERVEALARDQMETRNDRKADLSELKDVRQQVALVSQRLDEHVRRTELWEARRWSLIVLLIGAVLSLASGLIVTLAKK